MNERATSFGRSGNLVGIVSEGERAESSSTPDVIILNTGSTHKVGSFRMSVDLARSLAASGARVLRFDLSGLGDSRVRAPRVPGEDIPVSDVRDAMDFMGEHYGSKRFVLMGLCSGSDNAHRTAVADERVVGAVHLEGINYRTFKYFGLFYGPRFLSGEFITRQIARRVRGTKRTAMTVNAYERKFPPKLQVERDFTVLMRRGVRLFYVYNHGAHLYANYREQLHDAFPSVNFGDRLEVEIFPYAGHTYQLVRSRATAVARVVDWNLRHFVR